MTKKLTTVNGNHIPEETIGKENIPAPMAEPAVIIAPNNKGFFEELLIVFRFFVVDFVFDTS